MDLWYDGRLNARKGDIIRVHRAIVQSGEIRATNIENISGGGQERSHVDGSMMTVTPTNLDPPIVGRIDRLDRRDGNTHLTLSTGVYEEPNLFFEAGDVIAGQDALRRILRTDVRGYLKVADTYVSPATIELLGSTPLGTELRVLCGKIFELPQVKVKVAALCGMGYAIEVRREE